MAQHAKTMIYVLEVELKMEAIQAVKEYKRTTVSGPKLATCQLATLAENAMKSKLKLGNEHGRGKQRKNEVGLEWETQ